MNEGRLEALILLPLHRSDRSTLTSDAVIDRFASTVARLLDFFFKYES